MARVTKRVGEDQRQKKTPHKTPAYGFQENNTETGLSQIRKEIMLHEIYNAILCGTMKG